MSSPKKPVLVQINCSSTGSTGKIMRSISAVAQEAGFESHMICAGAYTKIIGPKELQPLSHIIEQKLQRKLNKFTGMYGCGFSQATKQLLNLLDEYNPDIVQLHNLHHHFFNIAALFEYLKKRQISTFWTMHDCWAWTGHCAHYMLQKCEGWKSGCKTCDYLHKYPVIYRDTAHILYQQKQKSYGNMANLTMIAPSEWLLKQKRQSFLCDIPDVLIPNGIDLNTFRPQKSGFREKHNIEDKFIVLGVSSEWTQGKGLDVFIRLAELLPDTSKIVLVGGRKSQVSRLPCNILWIPRTESQEQLAEIYSTADVFINPTREDNFPTVNLEALACGTPVITFPTGGSPESIDESCGIVLSQPDEMAILKAIKTIKKADSCFTKEKCIQRASLYDYRNCMDRYIECYRKTCGE